MFVITMTGDTMKKKDKYSRSGVISIAFLLALVGVNAIWLSIHGHGGPLIALALYLFVSYLFIRRRHFGAGVIAGLFGFGIHLIELLAKGTADLVGIDQVFFYANLILPVPLAFTSYLASRMEPAQPDE